MKNHSEDRWVCSSVFELADHLERTVHPALRAHLHSLHIAAYELEEGADVATLRSLVGQVGAALVAQMDFETNTLLPRMRDVERARLGKGPWPEHGPSLEHSLRTMRQEQAHARALVDALRATSRGYSGLHEAAGALGIELERDVDFEESTLLPKAIENEPRFGAR